MASIPVSPMHIAKDAGTAALRGKAPRSARLSELRLPFSCRVNSGMVLGFVTGMGSVSRGPYNYNTNLMVEGQYWGLLSSET